MRVKPVDESEVDHLGASLALACVGLLHFSFSGKYVVQSVTHPVLMQVLHIYAFVAALIFAWWNLSRNTNLIGVGLVFAVLATPCVLRLLARRSANDPPHLPFQPNGPASAQALSSLIAEAPKPLPDGYTAFLRSANGGEGFIGERYVKLWRVEELIGVNLGYNVAQFFPDMFFIGTDGGGEAYAFRGSGGDSAVFEVPFVGLSSDARVVADSFESFVSRASLDFVNE